MGTQATELQWAYKKHCLASHELATTRENVLETNTEKLPTLILLGLTCHEVTMIRLGKLSVIF